MTEHAENRTGRTRVLTILSKICFVLMCFFGLLFIPILALQWLSSSGAMPVSSPLYGFDFLPSAMLTALFVPTLVFALLAGRKKISLALVIVFALFMLFEGDHSLFYRHKTGAIPQGPEISVMTLNVAQFFPGVQVVAKDIANLQEVTPDVMFFQEINVPAELGREMVLEGFGNDYHVVTGNHCDYAILSRYPILEFHEVQLPSKQPGYVDNTPENQTDNPYRYFIHAVADVNGTKVHLLSLRLIAGRSVNFNVSPKEVYRWGVYLAQVQHQEAATMVDYIDKLEGPAIFAGDMNAPPNSRPMKTINRLGIDTMLANHLFPAATFGVDFPINRLDYVFCTGHFVPRESGTIRAKLSDHLPVYAKLVLRPEFVTPAQPENAPQQQILPPQEGVPDGREATSEPQAGTAG